MQGGGREEEGGFGIEGLTCTPMPPWMILGTFMLSEETPAAALGARSATLCSRLAGDVADWNPERWPAPAKDEGLVKAAAKGKQLRSRTEMRVIMSPPLKSPIRWIRTACPQGIRRSRLR